MKVSAPHRGWTSGRATPSLRPNPYAAKTANPAGRHLSFAEICPDNRSQLYRLLKIQEAYISGGKDQAQINVAKLARGMIKEHLALLGAIEKGGVRG